MSLKVEEFLTNISDGIYDDAKVRDLSRRKAYADAKKKFREDIKRAYEVTDNPKADKCVALAWRYGIHHSLEEVVTCFEDFIQLIK